MLHLLRNHVSCNLLLSSHLCWHKIWKAGGEVFTGPVHVYTCVYLSCGGRGCHTIRPPLFVSTDFNSILKLESMYFAIILRHRLAKKLCNPKLLANASFCLYCCPSLMFLKRYMSNRKWPFTQLNTCRQGTSFWNTPALLIGGGGA